MEKNEMIILAAVGVVLYVLLKKPAASAASGATSGAGALSQGGAAANNAGALVGYPQLPMSWDMGSSQTTDMEAHWPYSYWNQQTNTNNPNGDPLVGQLK